MMSLKALWWLILLVLSLQALPGAETKEEAQKEPVLFFYSQTCTQCHQMMGVLEKFTKEHKDVLIEFHEIEEEPKLWTDTCARFSIPVWGVPRIFIGDKVFAGWFEYQGNLVYYDSYHGYLGYRNQITLALETYFNVSLPLEATDNQDTSHSWGADEDCGC